jgi:sec-independent protein translocase protein TatC
MLARQELFQGLTHLRKALLQTAVMVVGLGILIFPFSKPLLRYIYEANLRVDLVAFGIPEAFFSLLKLTLYTSLFLSIPLLFYQLLRSFSSFLKARGVTSLFPILFTAVFLFYLGAFFCYFVTLPYGINFLMGYQSAHLRPLISVGKYVSFCFVFIFGFGLTFELPLILALLSYLKIVKAAFLTRNRRYAILLIAILSAVITPTPDFFNMTLMGGPSILLRWVILVKIIERKDCGWRQLPVEGEPSKAAGAKAWLGVEQRGSGHLSSLLEDARPPESASENKELRRRVVRLFRETPMPAAVQSRTSSQLSTRACQESSSSGPFCFSAYLWKMHTRFLPLRFAS